MWRLDSPKPQFRIKHMPISINGLQTSMSIGYDLLPDRTQEAMQQLYYTLHPRLSWRARRKVDRVDRTFVEQFFESDAEFEEYREEFFDGPITEICGQAVREAPDDMTIYDAHRDACAKLYALIRKRKPETLVETGVHNGVSTASMLLGLDANGLGKLISVDYADDRRTNGGESRGNGYFARGRPSCADAGSAVLPPDRESGWIIPDEFRDRWTLRSGRSQRELVHILSSQGEIDVFLHDSEYSTSCMLFEFELAWEWLRDGGLLLSSHIDRNKAFETFTGEHDCESGLFDYEYDIGYAEYTQPCSSGYILKEPPSGARK